LVERILKQLDTWFVEPTQGGDRPKLLSKLAILELSGWIEGEFDKIALEIGTNYLRDVDWVKRNVVEGTFGFHYLKHWRPMLVQLVGEVFARKIEGEMESSFPGELERMKGLLGTIWTKRCDFAHTDIATVVAAQQTFDAPSWAINQHKILTKALSHYHSSVKKVLDAV
jgi:hypothetical protein